MKRLVACVCVQIKKIAVCVQIKKTAKLDEIYLYFVSVYTFALLN